MTAGMEDRSNHVSDLLLSDIHQSIVQHVRVFMKFLVPKGIARLGISILQAGTAKKRNFF